MLKHKILLGSIVIAFTGIAHAQSTGTSTAPAAQPTVTAVPAVGATGSDGAKLQPGDTALVTIVTGNVSSTNSGAPSNDPLIQRRIAKKDAKDEYKAKKKAAKQEYKAEKQEANANLRAATQAEGAQQNNHTSSSK
jgi:hypothetical protein